MRWPGRHTPLCVANQIKSTPPPLPSDQRRRLGQWGWGTLDSSSDSIRFDFPYAEGGRGGGGGGAKGAGGRGHSPHPPPSRSSVPVVDGRAPCRTDQGALAARWVSVAWRSISVAGCGLSFDSTSRTRGAWGPPVGLGLLAIARRLPHGIAPAAALWSASVWGIPPLVPSLLPSLPPPSPSPLPKSSRFRAHGPEPCSFDFPYAGSLGPAPSRSFV
jgi:hypothetical protein